MTWKYRSGSTSSPAHLVTGVLLVIVLTFGVAAWGSTASAKGTSKHVASRTKPANWTELASVTRPPPLCGAAMAYDTATGSIVMFGGSTEDSATSALSETWLWSRDRWTKASPSQSPPARLYATMAYDPATKSVVLFGGLSAQGTLLNDTWTWNGKSWTKRSTHKSPPARESSALTYDSTTRTVVLFGGWSGTANLADTWTWNGTAWEEQSLGMSPPSRNSASMTYDPATKDVVLFGGAVRVGTFLNDTWAWNGKRWARLSPATIPSVRCLSMIAYDPTTKDVVLFGGSVFSTTRITYFGDTWSWNGTNWTRISAAKNPAPRRAGDMVYDSAKRALILFGGRGYTTSSARTILTSDTWRYGSELAESLDARVSSWLKASKAMLAAYSHQGRLPIALPLSKDIRVNKAKTPPSAHVVVTKLGGVPSFRSRTAGGQKTKVSRNNVAREVATVSAASVVYLTGEYWTQVTTDLYYWTPTSGAWAPTYGYGGYVANGTSAWTYDPTTGLWVGPTGELFNASTAVYVVTGLLYDPTTGNYSETGFTYNPTAGTWESGTGSLWNPTSGIWTSPTGAVYSPTLGTWTLATGTVVEPVSTTSGAAPSTVVVPTTTVVPITSGGSTWITYGGGTSGGT